MPEEPDFVGSCIDNKLPAALAGTSLLCLIWLPPLPLDTAVPYLTIHLYSTRPSLLSP